MKNCRREGLIIVISAPSGAGKTSIVRETLKLFPDIRPSISVTSRPRRRDEVEGEDYFFVSEDEFWKKAKGGELIEWAQVHGHYYGVPREFIEKARKDRTDVILAIDIQGGLTIKGKYPDSVLVFISAPSTEILQKRLYKRGTDDEETITRRIERAKEEMDYIVKYDYWIINDLLERAIEELGAIIIAERRRVNRFFEG